MEVAISAARILIYCPMAPTPPRIYDRTWRSIMALHWPEPLDMAFGKHDMQRYPQNGQGGIDLLEKYKQARTLTLEGGYDALLTVEADMIVPKAAIERLTRAEADVAYGLYVSRHGKHHWLAYAQVGADYRATGFSQSPELCQDAWGKVVETKGIGLGCTLIWRRVLEKIEFRLPETVVANDWFFALDVDAAGFRQVHDCGVVCGHIDGNTGRKVFWPTEDGGYREEAWHI